MLVEAQVSSTNTRRSGSRSSWPSNQASRRLTMSGRSCSEACAVFFARDVMAAAETPERGHADLSPLSGEPCLQLGRGDVGPRVERRVDQARMRLRLVREPVAAQRLGPRVAVGAAQRRPADRARGAHPEALRRLAARQARINGSQDARAKVKGQRLRHAGRPPSPARTLNQITPESGSLPTQPARMSL